MAREEKRLVLRTVDEDAAPVPVIRLGPSKEPEDKPVRLGPELSEPEEVLRVDEVDPSEFRSFEPGIEALIDKPEIISAETESTWGGVSRKQQPWGWLVLGGLVIIAAIVWSTLTVKKADKDVERVRTETHGLLERQKSEEEQALAMVTEIENTIRRFFASTTEESRSRWIRHPERVAPLLREYHSKVRLEGSTVKSIPTLQPLTIDRSGNFWLARVQLADGSKPNLVIEVTPEGAKVDWETLVCYQPMPWDEFVVNRPRGRDMDFRVYADHALLYSHEFSNEAEWSCYRLTALDSEEAAFGYARKGSETDVRLSNMLAAGPRASVILRLQIPEGLQSPRGMVIEKLVSERWLFIDPPAEQP